MKHKLPIECPCGCKQLPDGDSIKRHLGILATMVFICTLGLVALSSMERDRSASSEIASMPPGALQAAESTFPTISTTELSNINPNSLGTNNTAGSGNFNNFVPPANLNNQTYYYASANQAVLVPAPQITDIRHEMPSHMTLAVTSMDGKTKIKRIVGR